MQRRRRQRGGVARRLEDRHGPVGALLGLDRLARHEQVARDAHEAVGDGDRVVELLVQRGRRPPGVDRLAEAMRVVELPAVVVEHGRPLALAEPRQVRADRLEVRERLAVRPGPRGLARGLRADGEHGLDVARLDREVHQARAVGPLLAAAARAGRARSGAAARAPAGCARSRAAPARGGSRDGARRPRARRRARPPRACRCGRRAGRRRARSGSARARPRAARAPRGRRGRGGATRASTASTTVAGTASAGEASTSVTKNGLPPVTRCTASASAPVLAASCRTAVRESGGSASRCTGRPASAPSRRCSGCDGPSSSSRKRQDEHGGHRLDPPRHVAEHVDRRVVGPVDVLDDERRRRRGRELGHDRGEDAVDGAAVGERGGQRPAGLQRGVAQRAERPRRHQVVARRQQHPRAAGRRVREGADHAGLADPGSAADEHDRPAARGGVLDGADQCGERVVALEQDLVHHPNGPTP